MNKVIEFESQYGTIKIESREENQAGTRQFNSGNVINEKAKEKFEQSIEVLQSVSKAVIGKLNSTTKDLKPDEIEIKVGLKFSAEAGAFIAKTSAEGNLEVTIKWKKENKTDTLNAPNN